MNTHTSGAADLLYLLRRLLSNQLTFTAPEFRKELQKIVEDAALAAGQAVAPAPSMVPQSAEVFGSAAYWIGTAMAELDGVETADENNCLKAAIGALKKAEAATRPAPPAMDRGEDAEPTHWAVLAPCGQGVIFNQESDAQWTLEGDEDIGPYPTIGEKFRDCYDEGLVIVPLRIDAARAAQKEVKP